jgi:hypothetical protein
MRRRPDEGGGARVGGKPETGIVGGGADTGSTMIAIMLDSDGGSVVGL